MVRRRGHSPKTHGVWLKDDGIQVPLISGRNEEDYEDVRRRADELGLVRLPAVMSTAADVELKFAAKMRREGIQKATIVINNVPCQGPRSCDTLLPLFLPPGAELVIYGTDGFKKAYVGKSDAE